MRSMATNKLIKIVGSVFHWIIFLSINFVAEITWSHMLQLSVPSHQDNKRLQQIDSIWLVNEQKKKNPKPIKLTKERKKEKKISPNTNTRACVCVCVCVHVCVCDNHRIYLPGAKFQRLNGHECIYTYRCINIRGGKKEGKRIEGENEV